MAVAKEVAVIAPTPGIDMRMRQASFWRASAMSRRSSRSVLSGSSPITNPQPLQKHTRSQGPSLHQHYPASSVLWPCPTPVGTPAYHDVEAATLMPSGSPPITRTTFPSCLAHYPGGSNGCRCRLLPHPRGLPRYSGGSASAPSLSRPAQASRTLRPAGLLNRPVVAFVTRLQPDQLPDKVARQLPELSTTLRVEPSSTGDARLRRALNKAG
jgi:hypothetical protein